MWLTVGRRGRTASGALVLLVLGLAVALPGRASAAISWGGPIANDDAGPGPALTAVACPAATVCTALTLAGGVVSFDPAAPVSAAPTPIDASNPLAVACPAQRTCVGVDLSGQEVTFDPGSPGAASVHMIDPGQALTSVACPAASSCVAVDVSGDEVTFDPAAPAGAQVKQIDPGQSGSRSPILSGVACFAAPSASQPDCVAVDDAGQEVTFNTQDGSVSNSGGIDFSSQRGLTAVACDSPTQCVAFDGVGQQSVFAPMGGSISTRQLDPGYTIVAVTCTSATSCTALDSGGAEITFTPGSTAPRVPVDASQTASGLACPDAAHCVAVNAQGRAIAFDPATGTVSPPAPIDGAGSYSAVACARASQCTGADLAGNELTFDPVTGATVASGTVDPGAVTVYGIACPATTQCTLVDLNGNEVTFNPQAPSSPSSKQLVVGHPLLAIACPFVDQCTAVDDDRDEITFNPRSPGNATFALLGTPAGTPLTGIACPAASQCTAVDGTGEAVNFDPQAPGHPVPQPVLAHAAVAIACPSVLQCIAVDASGRRATFDPRAPAGVLTSRVDSSQPLGLACLTATWCAEIDSAGRAVEFDPHGDGATVARPVGATAALTGLSCGSAQACAVVDASGHAFAGSARLPPLPASLAAPRLRGRALQGDTLRASTGAWSNDPTSFAPVWERCSAHGRACRPIRGATGQAHRLTAADVGHTLRLREGAANQAGYALASAVSAPSAKVRGAPAPPRVSRARLRDSHGGRAQLSFTLTAARFGPSLRTLLVTLPRGTRFVHTTSQRGHRGASVVHARRQPRHRGKSARASTDGVSLACHRRRAAFTLGVRHGRPRIALRRPCGSLRVALASPALVIHRGLARRLRRRQRLHLRLTVALQGHGARDLRTTEAWTQR